MKKLTIILVIFMIGAIIFADDTPIKPKIVLIKISYGSGSVPAEGTVTFDAWILQHDQTFVTQNSTNCGYFIDTDADPDVGYIKIDCAELGYNWSSGDDLFVRSRIDLSGEQYAYDEQTFEIGEGSFESFDEGWNQEVLAVTLSSFSAVLMDGTPRLQWITQSEINNAGWNVFRGEEENQLNSQMINPEFIPGAGTTSEPTDYLFEDEYEVSGGSTYYYWLESVALDGESETHGPVTLYVPSGGENETPDIPLVYGLHEAYPNPFNPETTIEFILAEPADVELSIFNIKGQKVITLCDDFVSKVNEPVSFHWDGRDAQGRATGSGVYFYQLRSNKISQIKKMVLIK